ncbi:hypothetical protein M2323_004687 [Rhodoblastus acidophilus]|uniref:GP88 family protein n=1 Tax=Rhodoblastus acidophilus TaxID=1074 RepID=UPI002223F7FB|nr:hypothetical protein [Rhodoblastus acidophilus]MCW2286874.1 hypothetical protein [Rhodoblastus acidophilus]MCW2335731.1 hypothetical protein [Rhodoblastus acidophilus]
MYKPKMFSMDNPKALKAKGYGYLNAIHYMAPYTLGGAGNLCPNATPGCVALCLGRNSGQAGMVAWPADMNSVRQSRVYKARMFMTNRKLYMEWLALGIESALRKAEREGLTLVVRLNGASDIAWEHMKNERGSTLFDIFPDVQFVDYTKSFKRMMRWCEGAMPKNYHLTFSRTEDNEQYCEYVLALGGTVAAVFADGLPEEYMGYPVVDGDQHDLIHLQQRGTIIGLKPKGKTAKADTTGFVIRNY